jgi:hypothetical protein
MSCKLTIKGLICGCNQLLHEADAVAKHPRCRPGIDSCQEGLQQHVVRYLWHHSSSESGVAC